MLPDLGPDAVHQLLVHLAEHHGDRARVQAGDAALFNHGGEMSNRTAPVGSAVRRGKGKGRCGFRCATGPRPRPTPTARWMLSCERRWAEMHHPHRDVTLVGVLTLAGGGEG